MKPSINYTGSSTMMVSGVERGLPCAGVLPLSQLPNRKPLKVGQRVMELPVGTYCAGQAQGWLLRRPVPEPSHPSPAFVFLTLFSLPGYVAAEVKVYKFQAPHKTLVPVSVFVRGHFWHCNMTKGQQAWLKQRENWAQSTFFIKNPIPR